MSRIHSKITNSNGKLYIEDLQSTNGTLVDGERISEPAIIKDGNNVIKRVIRLGETNLFII